MGEEMNNQPFIQIGKALVNVNAIASIRRTKEGSLVIRLTGSHTLAVTAESADAVWNVLMHFVDQQHGGAPEAILVEPVLPPEMGKASRPLR
jgi:hypothetical protein